VLHITIDVIGDSRGENVEEESRGRDMGRMVRGGQGMLRKGRRRRKGGAVGVGGGGEGWVKVGTGESGKG